MSIGKYAVFAVEGPDKYGKTTHAVKLANALNAIYIKFPNEALWSGRQIRRILNKELPFEPASFQALQIINRLETFKQLKPNKLYIFDRYKMSGVVYGLCDGLPENWIREVCDYLPDPDMTFLFIGEPYETDTDIYSSLEYQDKITHLYEKEAKRTKNVHYINNHGTIEEVHKRIMNTLRRNQFHLG
jgi:thymidylate kinase